MSLLSQIASRRVNATIVAAANSRRCDAAPWLAKALPIMNYYAGLCNVLMEHREFGLFATDFTIVNSVSIAESVFKNTPYEVIFTFRDDIRQFLRRHLICRNIYSWPTKKTIRLVWDVNDERQISEAREAFQSFVAGGGFPVVERGNRLHKIDDFPLENEEAVIYFKIKITPEMIKAQPAGEFRLVEYWNAGKKIENIIRSYPKYKDAPNDDVSN